MLSSFCQESPKDPVCPCCAMWQPCGRQNAFLLWSNKSLIPLLQTPHRHLITDIRLVRLLLGTRLKCTFKGLWSWKIKSKTKLQHWGNSMKIKQFSNLSSSFENSVIENKPHWPEARTCPHMHAFSVSLMPLLLLSHCFLLLYVFCFSLRHSF